MSTTSFKLKRHIISALVAMPLALSATYAFADEAAVEAAPAAAAEPASPHSVTFNLGLYSEYMFRGVALSDGPALQGGIDYAHTSGFYAGTWWSNIDKNNAGHDDSGAVPFSSGNKLETDWYVGFAKTLESGFGYNFLANYYYYPDREDSLSASNHGHKQDSLELSAALSYKWLTYTFYYMPTDYYGLNKTDSSFTELKTNGDTKGATYNELKFNYELPVGKLNLLAKVGYQHTPGLQGSEGDMAFGLSRNFSLPSADKPLEGFSAGAYYTKTFSVKNQDFYVSTDGRDTNAQKLWFFVKRTW
jgi:uncharacterized protein (TIGR02001 family)